MTAEAKSTGSMPHSRLQRVNDFLRAAARADVRMSLCRRLSPVTTSCRPRQVMEACSRSRPLKKGCTCSILPHRGGPDTREYTQNPLTT
jgi:hypothetical protein